MFSDGNAGTTIEFVSDSAEFKVSVLELSVSDPGSFGGGNVGTGGGCREPWWFGVTDCIAFKFISKFKNNIINYITVEPQVFSQN